MPHNSGANLLSNVKWACMVILGACGNVFPEKGILAGGVNV